MKVLRFLLEKEFKLIMRNPLMMGIIIFFPLLLLVLFPWGISYDLKNVEVSIVNQDQSGTYSHALIRKIAASPSFEIKGYYQNYDDAINDVERGRSLIVMVIPQDFDYTLERDRSATVQVLTNGVDGTQAGIATSYLHQLLQDFSKDLISEQYPLKGGAPLEIIPFYEYNSQLNYKYFMLPAFVVIILTMFCTIFTAASLIEEKETGTMYQLNVTPLKPLTFVLSKIIPFWVVALITLSISVPIIYLMYGLSLQSNFLLYIFTGIIFSIAMTFLGVIIANASETFQQVMFMVLFFILIFYLISGIFTPVNAMPWWAQVIAYANPLTYYNRIIRSLYLKGSGLIDISGDLLILLAFNIIFGVIAVATYKKRA